jgi:hypothetical protein
MIEKDNKAPSPSPQRNAITKAIADGSFGF